MFMADVCCHKNAKLSGLPLRMRLLDDQKGHSAVAIVVVVSPCPCCRTPPTPPIDHPPTCVCVCAVFMALCLLITFAASAFHLWRNAPEGPNPQSPLQTIPYTIYGQYKCCRIPFTKWGIYYICCLKYNLQSIDINKSVAYELRFNEYFFVLC